MNPETEHQLYGGEITDYVSRKYPNHPFEDPQLVDTNIANVYDTQVKGKPSIDTTGIISMNFGSIPKQRDPHFDAVDNLLKQTLNEVAKQIGLEANDQSTISPQTVSLKDQTQQDIEHANNNVLQAIKELQDLKAI
jgi:hypothetical protein